MHRANEDLAKENVVEEQTAGTIDRRSAARKAGKFLAYTAPVLIALITAKDANATS
jgi:hypothetical protein